MSEGNCVPLDWIWKVYALANARSDDGNWRELSEREISKSKKEFLFKGPRGGSKTESIAALWFTISWFAPNYSVTHTSTEVAQATTCLSYVAEWASSSLFKGMVDKANSRVGVIFKNGSRFVIRTGSLDGLNHEHTISLSLDEVETFPMDLVGQAMQIPQKQVGSPYPSIILLASTQKKPELNMARHIKDALTKGKYCYMIWNCFDIGERCKDERREDLPPDITCADYPGLLEELSELGTRKRTDAEDAIYEKLNGYLEALETNCPLVIDCHGRLINATGHLSIDTLITRITTLDRETWKAENLCEEAARGSSVYKKLSAANLSEDAVYIPGQRVYAGVDYGMVGALTVATFWGINGAHVDCIAEYGVENAFEEDLIPVFIDFQRKYNVKSWAVDNSALNLVAKMRKAGLPARRVSKTPKLFKIDHVAGMICDGRNFRRLRFHPVNAYSTYEQMLYYGFKKDSKTPKDGDDDYCDSAGYGLEQIQKRAWKKLKRNRSKPPGRSLADPLAAFRREE
jgi:hypothetical protein